MLRSRTTLPAQSRSPQIFRPYHIRQVSALLSLRSDVPASILLQRNNLLGTFMCSLLVSSLQIAPQVLHIASDSGRLKLRGSGQRASPRSFLELAVPGCAAAGALAASVVIRSSLDLHGSVNIYSLK